MFKCKNVGAAKGSWEISNPKYIQSTNASKTLDSRPTVHSRNKKQLILLFSKKHFPNNNNNNNSSQLRCYVQFHSVVLPRSVEATEPRTLRFHQGLLISLNGWVNPLVLHSFDDHNEGMQDVGEMRSFQPTKLRSQSESTDPPTLNVINLQSPQNFLSTSHDSAIKRTQLLPKKFGDKTKRRFSFVVIFCISKFHQRKPAHRKRSTTSCRCRIDDVTAPAAVRGLATRDDDAVQAPTEVSEPDLQLALSTYRWRSQITEMAPTQ